MREGGKIVGSVLAADGSPLAGVVVTTMPPNVIEVPFLRDLQMLMVTEVTRSSVRTDGQGKYRFENLAGSTYQLKFEHPEAFVKYVRDVVVTDQQTTNIETLRMERGTLVHGIVTVDGQPGIGVKVSISTSVAAPLPGGLPGAVDPTANAAALAARFSDETVTNERGEFQFPRRVPPGEYTLRAGRQQGNPLTVMLDFKKTEQTITLLNQDSFEFSPNIPSN
jgi:hypothetical protein